MGSGKAGKEREDSKIGCVKLNTRYGCQTIRKFCRHHMYMAPYYSPLLLLQFVFSAAAAALFPWLPIYLPSFLLSSILSHKTSPRVDVDSLLLSFSQQKSLSVSEVASDSPSLVYFGFGSVGKIGRGSVCVSAAITAIDGVMMAFKLALLFTEMSSGVRAEKITGRERGCIARSFD